MIDAQTWLPLQQFETPVLRANLGYLSTFDPKTAQQIQCAASDELIEVSSQGNIVAARTASQPPQWLFGQSPAQEITTIRQSLQSISPETELVILIGSKAGYAANLCLPLLKQRPQFNLVLIEPSAARMKLCLSTCDLRDGLATGRLHMHITREIESELWEAVNADNLWGAAKPRCIRIHAPSNHAFLAEFEREYSSRSQAALKRRSEILSTLKQGPPSLSKPIERVLLIDCWPGAPQQIHIEAMQGALNKRGIQNRVIQLQGYRFDLHPRDYRRSYEHALLNLMTDFHPDAIVSYAYHAPQIAAREIVDAVGAPWVQVVSNIAYYDRDYFDNEIAAVIDKRLVALYQQRGAPKAAFVPIMADYVADAPSPTSGELPIVFIGNSLGLQPRERDHWLQTWKPRERTYQAIIDAEQALSDFDLQLNLYDYLEQNPLPDLQSEIEEFQAFRYLLCQATAARRVQILERLTDKGLHVFGNWEHSLRPDSPLRACLRGPLPMEQERNMFKRGSIFINIHSTGHLTGPNMRFFNVAGMGGFSLSDGAFGEFLTPGVEYAVYRSLNELDDAADHYLNHPDEMNAIREQGRARVQKDWTYDNWLDWIEVIIQRSFRK